VRRRSRRTRGESRWPVRVETFVSQDLAERIQRARELEKARLREDMLREGRSADDAEVSTRAVLRILIRRGLDVTESRE